MHHRSEHEKKAHVMVSPEEVAIKVPGRSALVCAKVLGRRELPGGRVRLWLDREVTDGRVQFEGWTASGPYTTILTSQAPAIAGEPGASRADEIDA